MKRAQCVKRHRSERRGAFSSGIHLISARVCVLHVSVCAHGLKNPPEIAPELLLPEEKYRISESRICTRA